MLTKIAYLYKEARSIDAQNRRRYEHMARTLETTSPSSGVQLMPMEEYQQALLTQRSNPYSRIPVSQEKRTQYKDLFQRFNQLSADNPNIDLSTIKSRLQRLANGPISQYSGYLDRATSEPIAWPRFYHGTDVESAKRIVAEGVDPNRGTRGLYGRGFYLANKDLATDYANQAIGYQLNMVDEAGNPQPITGRFGKTIAGELTLKDTVENRAKSNSMADFTLQLNAGKENEIVMNDRTIRSAIQKYIANNEYFPGLEVSPQALVSMINPNEMSALNKTLDKKIMFPRQDQVRKMDAELISEESGLPKDAPLGVRKRAEKGLGIKKEYAKAGGPKMFHLYATQPYAPELFRIEPDNPNPDSMVAKYQKQFPSSQPIGKQTVMDTVKKYMAKTEESLPIPPETPTNTKKGIWSTIKQFGASFKKNKPGSLLTNTATPQTNKEKLDELIRSSSASITPTNTATPPTASTTKPKTISPVASPPPTMPTMPTNQTTVKPKATGLGKVFNFLKEVK